MTCTEGLHTLVGVLRLLAVFALGFGAAVFFVVDAFFGSAAALVVGVFLGAARFLGAAALVVLSF